MKTIMIRTALAAFFLSMALTAQAEPLNLALFSTIGEEHKAYQTDFNAIMSQSLDELARFTVIDARGKAGDEGLDELLVDARASGAEALAEASLGFKGRRATLGITIHDAQTGEVNFQFTKEYRLKDIKALLAQLEFEVPIELKSRLKEVGRVIKKESQTVYFDLGRTANVSVGGIYQVFREGKDIKNRDGNSFGKLKQQTGVVRVTDVTSMYATAEILLGRISIKPDDYVERIPDTRAEEFRGTILAVLDDQVAINLGRNIGVKEGSYYAVFKDVQPINETESFREKLGQVRINNVYEDYSTGVLGLSEHYRLSKVTLKAGDSVEEIESPRKNLYSLGQLATNLLGTSESIPFLGFQLDSATNVNMAYRFRIGADEDAFGSVGVMSSINHSPYFFYGVDVVYVDGSGANLFLSVDVPTPISNNLYLNLETGYILGAGEAYEGLNTSLSIKLAF